MDFDYVIPTVNGDEVLLNPIDLGSLAVSLFPALFFFLGNLPAPFFAKQIINSYTDDFIYLFLVKCNSSRFHCKSTVKDEDF